MICDATRDVFEIKARIGAVETAIAAWIGTDPGWTERVASAEVDADAF